MRRLIPVLAVLALLLVPAAVGADGPCKGEKCVAIKDGVLEYSSGHYLENEPLVLGFDPFGYNYQGKMFKESYANAYLGRYGFPPYEGDDEAYLSANPDAEDTWVWPYRNDELLMKWNDAWLSNQDCDENGSLDRYFGFASYIGSGAWLTNHQSGEYEGEDGKVCKWNYFVKIVAVPADAVEIDNVWYAADGTEIGPEIWGAFAIIQQVENDPCKGLHGLQYVSPGSAGLGQFSPTKSPAPPPALSADVNADGCVDILDLSMVGAQFGAALSKSPAADINGDGQIDILDIVLIAQEFGRCG